MNSIVLKDSSSLSEYIRHVHAFPMLSYDEEQSLVTKFTNGDQSAGKRVVESHLRLVVSTAFEMKKYHANLADLISEGNLGLLRALKSFSLSKNVRFSVYASLWIKASIQDFILRSISIVRVGTTAAQKRIIFGLSKVKRALKIIDNKGFEKNIGTVADALGVKVEDIREFSAYISAPDLSLNAMVSDESESEMIDVMPSQMMTPEEGYMMGEERNFKLQMLNDAMQKLSDRERDVVTKRFMKSAKLAEISKEYGVSVERVRQIEAAALKKMKNFVAIANA